MKQAPSFPRTGDYVLEEQVGHLLRRAHQRHTAIFQETMGALQLTPTQFAALVKLSDESEVSQNQLGRLIFTDPATTQGVIRRLKQRGLIASRPDPADGRRRLWRLSDRGAALLPDAIRNGRTITQRTLEPLSAPERQALLSYLERLR